MADFTGRFLDGLAYSAGYLALMGASADMAPAQATDARYWARNTRASRPRPWPTDAAQCRHLVGEVRPAVIGEGAGDAR